ncbi:hypothetical protein J1614_000586 [Plenodomus biglobosus]|nr:hypothetical protein J1614_000586 [Plenodomus biglobosus]
MIKLLTLPYSVLTLIFCVELYIQSVRAACNVLGNQLPEAEKRNEIQASYDPFDSEVVSHGRVMEKECLTEDLAINQ